MTDEVLIVKKFACFPIGWKPVSSFNRTSKIASWKIIPRKIVPHPNPNPNRNPNPGKNLLGRNLAGAIFWSPVLIHERLCMYKKQENKFLLYS